MHKGIPVSDLKDGNNNWERFVWVVGEKTTGWGQDSRKKARRKKHNVMQHAAEKKCNAKL